MIEYLKYVCEEVYEFYSNVYNSLSIFGRITFYPCIILVAPVIIFMVLITKME